MFPPNLHKNIVQLDRQISLLEKECENMDAKSKKKSYKSEPTHCKSSRIPSFQLKSPKVKVHVKKNDCLRKNKITPPRSSRIQSSSSLQSQCSKSWNESCGRTVIGRKTTSYGGNDYLQSRNFQAVSQTQCNLKTDCKTRSSSCNEKHLSDFANDGKSYVNKENHILHKEVLIPNPGGAIEVIVTQKSKSKENSPVVKTKNAESASEKNIKPCKCQKKGPKWSEILHLETAKKKEMIIKNSECQTLTGVKDLISPSEKFDFKVREENYFHKNNYSDKTTAELTFEAPVKLSPEILRNKNISETNRKQFGEIQCCLENNCKEKKNIQCHVEPSNKNSRSSYPEKNNSQSSSMDQKTEFFHKWQQNLEKLIGEKEKLIEELAAKEDTLKSMKKREEEYISIITSLKSSLLKLREQVQEDAKALKELNVVETELAEQKKISEAIKKGHSTLQVMFERCALDNHKLQTQIKLLKLESQKHDVLLAGKDAEINRYRDEIKNFQRQLAEHIELLKSNSQGLDAGTMMDSIIHQSQLFFEKGLDSAFLEDIQKDFSKPNGLIHSSPTSTKTSVLNSSWNAISSIRDCGWNKGDSEFVIDLKEDSNTKEFFHIFGYSSSDSKSTESPETLIEKFSERKDLKNSCSFTSCVSLRDGSDYSESKNDHILEKGEPIPEPNVNKVALRKVQSNIDDLLKNLKSKWSKEIFESSGANSTIKDFLNDSQISSITQ